MRPARPAVRRRALLLGLGIALPPLLVSCAEEEPEPVGPAPITEVGAEAVSPSGAYVAVIDVAGDSVGVLLRDAAGEDLWADAYGYTRKAPPALLWEAEQDVLWVVTENGAVREHVRIAPTESGGWAQEAGAEPPEEITRRL